MSFPPFDRPRLSPGQLINAVDKDIRRAIHKIERKRNVKIQLTGCGCCDGPVLDVREIETGEDFEKLYWNYPEYPG